MQKGIESGKGAEAVKKTKAVFCFKITGGKTWVLDLKNGSGKLTEGEGKADCTITIGDADFAAMAEGKLDGMQAFMGGKLKIAGNMMLAQKLGSIMDKAKELRK